MHFLLDQNVARGVAEAIVELGHTCEYSRALVPANAADPVVALAAEETGSILVSHDRDFSSIAPRVAVGQKARFRRLSRIALECPEPMAAARIRELMPIIEHLVRLAETKPDKRVIIAIGKTAFRAA